MRTLLLLGALAIGAALPTAAPAATSSSWSDQANQVCVVWLAKAKKEFGTPVTAAQLYGFAIKAKTLEAQELVVLRKIPGATPAGKRALAAMLVDLNEVGSAITAWQAGDAAKFVKILKAYLNDSRAKTAFAAAGATKCG
ncbi:MAG: hypothetical protein ACXVZL_03610 [Gaiellaceae bacterium]